MEYPNLLINVENLPFINKLLLEDVIAHEVSHQWFFGMLGSNEMDNLEDYFITEINFNGFLHIKGSDIPSDGGDSPISVVVVSMKKYMGKFEVALNGGLLKIYSRMARLDGNLYREISIGLGSERFRFEIPLYPFEKNFYKRWVIRL